jgi:hypothetical protein
VAPFFSTSGCAAGAVASFGRSLPRRLERAAVVVIPDVPHSGAGGEHDIPSCLGRHCRRSLVEHRRVRSDRVGRAGRVGHPLRQTFTLDGPQATHVLAALSRDCPLPAPASQVVIAVTVRHTREDRGDAAHEGVLLVRNPAAHRQAQALDPRSRPCPTAAAPRRPWWTTAPRREPHPFLRQLLPAARPMNRFLSSSV